MAPKHTIETPYGRRFVDDAALGETIPRAPTADPNMQVLTPPERGWTAETWAKVVGAAVGVLTLIAIVVAYGVTLKGEVQAAKDTATAAGSAAERVAPVEHRVTVLETDVGNHKLTQADREKKLDDTLDDLRKSLEIVNVNVSILGAQSDDTRHRMRPLPPRPRDIKP